MKTLLPFILSLGCIGVPVVAQENVPSLDEKSGYYEFLGAEILAPYRSKPRPVVSADKKGIYVADGNKTRRVAWSSPCMATPKMSASNRLIKVENLSHDFYYRKNSQYEERAYHDIQAKDRDTAFKIAQIGPTGGIGSGSADAVAALEMERDEFEDQMESLIQNDDLIIEGHADSIYLRLTVTPPVDLDEAYCAVMVGYRKTDGNTNSSQRRVAVRVHRLGKLLQDIPEEVSFSLFLGEGDYRNSQFEIFLFSGDGSPLPTSLSRRLKMLTNIEFEKYR